MKKVIYSAALLTSLVLTSCGAADPEELAKEFCACAEKAAEEKDACIDEWAEKHKGAKIKEEDAETLANKMIECDPLGALSAISKLQ